MPLLLATTENHCNWHRWLSAALMNAFDVESGMGGCPGVGAVDTTAMAEFFPQCLLVRCRARPHVRVPTPTELLALHGGNGDGAVWFV